MTDGSVFDIGDIVTLKSGSPNMTVTNIVSDTITVEWINANQMFTESFPTDALTIVG